MLAAKTWPRLPGLPPCSHCHLHPTYKELDSTPHSPCPPLTGGGCVQRRPQRARHPGAAAAAQAHQRGAHPQRHLHREGRGRCGSRGGGGAGRGGVCSWEWESEGVASRMHLCSWRVQPCCCSECAASSHSNRPGACGPAPQASTRSTLARWRCAAATPSLCPARPRAAWSC